MNVLWFFGGMAAGLLLASYFRDRDRVDQSVDGNKMVDHQPQPDFAYGYMEREARRIERPLYERSTPAVVMRDKA